MSSNNEYFTQPGEQIANFFRNVQRHQKKMRTLSDGKLTSSTELFIAELKALRTKDNAKKIDALIEKAKNNSAMPMVDLAQDLRDAGLEKLATEVENGKYND